MSAETPYKLPKHEDTKVEHSKDVKECFTIEGSSFSQSPIDHIIGFHALDPLPYWPYYLHACYFLSICEGSLWLYNHLPCILKDDESW